MCLRWGNISFPSVCQSACYSVIPSTQFSGFFLCCPSRYWLEIWYVNLSWSNADQDWLMSCLTYFYMSYCHLFKISFYLPCLWEMNLSTKKIPQNRIVVQVTCLFFAKIHSPCEHRKNDTHSLWNNISDAKVCLKIPFGILVPMFGKDHHVKGPSCPLHVCLANG